MLEDILFIYLFIATEYKRSSVNIPLLTIVHRPGTKSSNLVWILCFLSKLLPVDFVQPLGWRHRTAAGTSALYQVCWWGVVALDNSEMPLRVDLVICITTLEPEDSAWDDTCQGKSDMKNSGDMKN